VFESSDISKDISWEEFVKKGYYVIPAEPEKTRVPVSMRAYAEGRNKDTPEPIPLPSQWTEEFGKGLETQSGKIEFVSSSLKRLSPQNPERPPLNRYIPSFESRHTKPLADKYPLQMISSHPRFSFHTHGDGKDSTLNDVVDHRITIDGYAYWVMRVHPDAATKRGIRHHDLIRVFNDRGAVLCAADVSPLVPPEVVKAFESCAVFDPIPGNGPGGFVDRGGCVNLLTNPRPQQLGTEGMAANSCLVDVELWRPAAEAQSTQRARA
jgi:trimethylamine-N-oxide reductase (cytochrome c)